MSYWSFFLFFSIFLAIYSGMHYYLYQRIASGLSLSPGTRLLLLVLFLLGALSFFVGEVLSRRILSSFLKPVVYSGSVWLGVISIGLTVFVLRDLLLLFFPAPLWRSPSAAVAITLTLVCSAYALYNVWTFRELREIRLKIPALPEHLSGFSIVQLSDLHINHARSERWIRRIAEQANGLKPDLIVLTGDIIDADICRRDEVCRTLGRLSAPHGVYAVTGNHEYYAGMEKFLAIAKQSGITVLRNEKVTVAGGIDLIGIEDTVSSRGIRAKEALRTIIYPSGAAQKERPLVLLSHRPDTFDAARELGVDLQLSGHTHAGQIPPLDLIVLLSFKYPVGLHYKDGAWAYTTTGTGFWGPPMRLFSRSEIVKFVLER